MMNSGATLIRGLEKVLEGLPWVGSSIEGTVVYNDIWEEHLRTLNELFHKLREATITARPIKCLVGAT